MLLLTLILVGLFAAQASAEPLRIMPMGDSITAGYTDNPVWNVDFEFGYRSGLYTRLTNAGYDFQFVGGSTEPFDDAFPGDPTRNGTYTPPIDLQALGQDGHRGYGGKAGPFFLANAPNWMVEDEPDLILMHIGTNGQQFTDELDELVSHVVSTRPEVQILLAEIIPKRVFNASIVTYNSYVRDTLLPKYEALGARVSVVDHYTPFLTDSNDPTTINTAYMATGNHPNGDGYDVMAQTWFDGIEQLTSSSDFNLDGVVDGEDLTDAAQGWSTRYSADLDGTDFLSWQSDLESPQQRLVMTVDLGTGDAVVENFTTLNYSIDGYTISSASGSLHTSWDSLEDQGEVGWQEVSPTAGRLSELNPTNALSLPASAVISLSGVFDVVSGIQDLQFQFRDQTLGTINAEVVYLASSEPIANSTTVPEPTTGLLAACGIGAPLLRRGALA